MATSKQSPDMQFLEEARLITRWTRRYAQSRTFPMLPLIAFYALIPAGFILLGYSTAWTFFTGHTVAFGCSLAAVLALCAYTVWFSIPQWGFLAVSRLGGRYYKREGDVTVPGVLPLERMKKVGRLVALLCGAAILTQISLAFAGYITPEHMQPISALYVVPFTVFIALSTRTYITLLFPLLYGLHAILLTAGIPLPFSNNPGKDQMFTMIGYMALTAVVGHVYNRYALARLKRAARTPDAGEAE